MTAQRIMVPLLLPFITTIVLLTGDACAFSLGYYHYEPSRTGATKGRLQSRRVGLAPPLPFDATHQRRQSPYRSTARQWSPLLASSGTALKAGISTTTTVGRRTCLSSSYRRPSTRVVMHASVGDNGDSDESNSINNSASSSVPSPTTTWTQRLRRSVSKAYQPKEDGLTFRQRLAKMGLATVLSYGWVSNMSYGVSVSTAWYIFSKRTGLSPLAPGQWKRFLAVYAGFFVFNNIVRPIRLAVSVGVAPKFDAAVSSLQSRLKISRTVAIVLMVFLANIVCTCTVMALGIFAASLLAGVPVFVTASSVR